MPWVPSDQKIASMQASYKRHLEYAREYNRAMRAQRKEVGLCMRCGKEDAEPGGVNCTACRLWVNQSRSGYTGRGRNRRLE